jgi:hypothetical protein
MLAKTVQSCLNGWSVCFGDAVARNAPLQPQLRRRGQPWVFRSTPGCMRARGAIALPPRQQKRAWAQGLRTRARPGIRIRMRMWVHVQCSPIPHSSMPAGQRELGWPAIAGCAPCAAAGSSQHGLGLGLISAAMEANSLRARMRMLYMRMPGRECKALELNPPRALLLARRKCDGLAHAQPRRGRAAHAKTQRRPELPADLRLQGPGGVYMCAPLHHRNKPTIHSIMIVLSSPACIRAIMNAFMFHIGAA